ncbi:MAG: LysM peptidoglycan-binding domain-containing protein [Anaerolineae bacterium]
MNMNLLALLPFFLLGLGLAWALWLIFKRNILEQGIVTVVTYFIGVIITFLLVGWIVGNFLPGWSVELLSTARQSEEVQTIEVLGREIWQEAMGEAPPLPTPPMPAPTLPTPAPTVSPVGEPEVGESEIGAQGAVGGNEVRYEVQSGDTLHSIARRFDVSVADIQQRNGLWNPNLIHPGDILIIPAP